MRGPIRALLGRELTKELNNLVGKKGMRLCRSSDFIRNDSANVRIAQNRGKRVLLQGAPRGLPEIRYYYNNWDVREDGN